MHSQEYWARLQAQLDTVAITQVGRAAPVVGFAGILGGSPLLGTAHRMLPAIGIEVDAAGVGLTTARSRGNVLDGADAADTSSAEHPTGSYALLSPI